MSATTTTGGLDLLRRDLAGEGLRLVRAWPRSAGHLLLHVRAADGPADAWVPGQWFADRGRAAAVARTTPGARSLPDAGVVLQPAGADRRLVVLAGLLAEPGAELVAHRPERRAVLRRTGRGVEAYTKAVPPSRVEALLASAGWRPDGVRVPEVVDADRAAGTITTAALPGRTLHARAAAGGTDEDAWRCAGEAVATLHRSAPPAGAVRHGTADEVAVTLTWLARAQEHGALDHDRLLRHRAAVGQALAGLDQAPGPSVSLHRDLHDKQVVVDGAEGARGAGAVEAALLDLDLVAVGEPGLDVANLLVHLSLRDEQAALRAGPGPRPAAPARARAFLAGYGDVLDRERLRRLAVLAAVRVAAVYAFREPLRAAGAGQAPGGARGVPDAGGVEVGDRLVRSVLAGLPGG